MTKLRSNNWWRLRPPDRELAIDDARLDLFASAFARVIDAKSPWTFRHSEGVADIAGSIGRVMGLDADASRSLRRSALLHDIGKLGVSNLILDKPGRLTDEEFVAMRRHAAHSLEILSRVPCFAPLASAAAGHHERLDGKGYHRGLTADGLSLTTRILAVADVCDALRSSRPYREGLPTERVLEIMSRDVGTAFDTDVMEALRRSLDGDGVMPSADAPAARVVTSLAEDYGQAA